MYCTGLKTTNNEPPKSSRPCAVVRPIFVSFRVTHTTTAQLVPRTFCVLRSIMSYCTYQLNSTPRCTSTSILKDLEHFNKTPTKIHHSSPRRFTSGLVNRSLTPHLTSSLQRTEARSARCPTENHISGLLWTNRSPQPPSKSSDLARNRVQVCTSNVSNLFHSLTT